MADASDYVSMLTEFYNRDDRSVETIVGNYTFHENFPYESLLLHINGDVRKPIFDDFSDKRAFDIACGEGRMIRRMAKVFGQGCDGADISRKMVEAARARSPGAQVHVSSGRDCGAAESEAYDFAFCTISLQHIASHTVRSEIVRDLVRILKPSGKMTLQFLVAKHYPFLQTDVRETEHEVIVTHSRDAKHASYFEDRFDAAGTNSSCDCVIGMRDIPAVVREFRQFFDEVGVWFHDISTGRGLPAGVQPPLNKAHPNNHLSDRYHGTHYLFVHGSGVRKP